ncbi:hypothetical protein KEM54_006877 [Ascosphaera aggregata]|nr:hypothetical protein KEM54_006877 [Ascosphaera aggregata]
MTKSTPSVRLLGVRRSTEGVDIQRNQNDALPSRNVDQSAGSGSDDELSRETPTAIVSTGRTAKAQDADMPLPRTRRTSARKRQAPEEPQSVTREEDGATPVQLRHSDRKRRPPKWIEMDSIVTPLASSRRRSSGTHSRRKEVDEGATYQELAKEDGDGAAKLSSSLGKEEKLQYGADGDNEPGEMSVQQSIDTPSVPSCTQEKLPPYAKKLAAFLKSQKTRAQMVPHVRSVLDKLMGKRPIPLQGLDDEYHAVHQLLEQTVVAGEGNSLLILGSRGTGKTTIVEAAIRELSSCHSEDFHVVRLDGFLHADDRIALREIWRQLGREMNAEQDIIGVQSYADTMASLLALLSHPEELFGVSGDPDTLATAKSVIIILDEFDLFAHHARQTLLYNLFDIAQSRKAPLSVIGITTKVEVTENLEKRVKSRYSHRHVFVPRPRGFEAFHNICKAAILSNETKTDDKQLLAPKRSGTKVPAPDEQWNAYVEVRIPKSYQSKGMFRDGCGSANSSSQGLLKDDELRDQLQMIFYQTNSPGEFFSSSIYPLTRFYHSLNNPDPETPISVPTPQSFRSLTCPDPAPFPFQQTITSSSSTTSLPLSLLLAATRLTAIHDTGSVSNYASFSAAPLSLSFAAVYSEYVRLITSAKVSASVSGAAATSGRVWSKDVAREAWEKLAEWGLIVPANVGTAGAGDLRKFRMETPFEEVLDELGEQEAGGALGKWWRET